MIDAWVPGALAGFGGTVISGALLYWRSSSVAAAVVETKISAIIETRLSQLDKSDEYMGRKLDQAASELQTVATDLKVFMNEYKVTQEVQNKTMIAIVSRLEDHERRITVVETRREMNR